MNNPTAGAHVPPFVPPVQDNRMMMLMLMLMLNPGIFAGNMMMFLILMMMF
ncbi:MAG: hypothetical protein FWE44_01160 [Defluviitaleaceae bacterium]|nr:hypothetical protein [Defluviitaleaceae bacterium]